MGETNEQRSTQPPRLVFKKKRLKAVLAGLIGGAMAAGCLFAVLGLQVEEQADYSMPEHRVLKLSALLVAAICAVAGVLAQARKEEKAGAVKTLLVIAALVLGPALFFGAKGLVFGIGLFFGFGALVLLDEAVNRRGHLILDPSGIAYDRALSSRHGSVSWGDIRGVTFRTMMVPHPYPMPWTDVERPTVWLMIETESRTVGVTLDDLKPSTATAQVTVADYLSRYHPGVPVSYDDGKAPGKPAAA